VLRRTAVVLAGLASAVLLLEAGLRLRYRLTDAPSPAIYDSLFDRAEPPVLYVFKPRLDTDYYGVRLRTNSLGMRGAEPPAPDPSRRRVLVLGDSFAAGLGLPDEDTLPARLESALRGPPFGLPADVLNGSVHGYNTAQQAAWLDRFGRRLRPDLVVVVFFLNDALLIHDVDQLLRNEVYRGETSWPLQLVRRTAVFAWLRAALPVLVEKVERRLHGQDYYHRLWDEAHNPAGLETFRRSVAEVARIASEEGFPVVAALYPYLTRRSPYPYREMHDRAAGVFRDAGIEAVDLAPLLDGTPLDRLVISPINTHPSAEAHRRAAARLAPSAARLLSARRPAGRSPSEFDMNEGSAPPPRKGEHPLP
jgi:lysophospholipase L1-like esterase